MERARFDQIEVFVREFRGPANQMSEAYREECLSEAMELLSEAADLSAEDASDYYPQASWLLWLAETIDVISANGEEGTTTIQPVFAPNPFGMTDVSYKALEDIIFDRLAEDYPFLLVELQLRRDSFNS